MLTADHYKRELTAREIVFEITAAAIALLLIASAVTLETIAEFKTGNIINLPEWHALAVGAVLGYFFTRNGGTKSIVLPHDHLVERDS